nr:hypothetical protein [Tanacetum cinerariifolium]
MNGFKECSSCGAFYNKSFGYSKRGFIDNFVRGPNKTPDSSQRPPHDYLMCGNLIDCLHCRQCALLRKKLKEVWFTICDEHQIFQDFLNTFESSSDNTNIVNEPQEPFVFNQDPGKNSSQSPPHIDHHCCYGCSDSLDDDDDDEESSTPLRDIIIFELPPYIEITSVLYTKEPKDSLSIGDEHLDTIPEKESDEFIKFSVENLVLSPSESGDLSNIGNSSIISSFKIDSLLDELADEFIFLKSILSGIDKADCDPEEEIHLIEKLFDSLMEEIDLSLTPDDSMPPGIKNDDYDSERDILFLEELLSNDSHSLPKNESFHFDIPSSLRPPAKPPDNDGIYFDDEPVTGILTVKVVGDISEHYVLMPRLLHTQPTLCPLIDTLLLFSSKNEDKVHLLSHQGFKAFQLSSESPKMIYGGNIPNLDVSFLRFYSP